MIVKCPRCGYEWKSRAKLNYVTCPNCRKVFKKPTEEEGEK